MSDVVSRHLIAYDIADDIRRSHVAKHLQAYGMRVQYSVFLVDLKPAKVQRLLDSLSHLVDSEQDSVLVCCLGPVSSLRRRDFHYLGRSRPEPSQGPVII